MHYISQFFWKKSTIGYGCLVLLGSVTVAGIAEIEIKGQVFSKWIGSISNSIQLRQSSPQQSQQDRSVTADQVFYPFSYIGGEVKKISLQIWPFLKGAFGAIWMLKDYWSTAFESIKNFLSNLFDSEIFNRIFENLHQKIWNILVFAIAGGKGRDTFIALFGKDKQESTLLAAQLLLGQTVQGIKNFKVKPNVFHYLFLKWMDKPQEVTGKFDRLSTSIKKLTDKLKKGSESSTKSSQEDSPNHVYWLTIPTVQEYLNVREGWSENIFNAVWTGEVLLKIRTGVDDQVGAKLWASTIGGFFGEFGQKSIQRYKSFVKLK